MLHRRGVGGGVGGVWGGAAISAGTAQVLQLRDLHLRLSTDPASVEAATGELTTNRLVHGVRKGLGCEWLLKHSHLPLGTAFRK